MHPLKKYSLATALAAMNLVFFHFLFFSGHHHVSKSFEIVFPTGYHKPDDLFFALLKEDRPAVSQTPKEHFARNGYLAIDVSTGGKKDALYAPSYEFLDDDGIVHDEEREFKVHISSNPNTMGKAIELNWLELGIPHTFILGHTSQISVGEGDKVKTGQFVGTSGGCPGELQENEASTGCHLHFEHRIAGEPTPYPAYLYSNHGADLVAVKRMRELEKDSEQKIKDGKALKWDDARYFAAVAPIATAGDAALPKAVSAIHNRENGRCAEDCSTSLAGARGPMQFMKNTWEAYGLDGNGDGVANVEDIDDAIAGTANYLESIYENESKQAPGLDKKWIWWRVACRYNSGYQFPCTHADAPKGVVAYADAFVADLEAMQGL